MKRWDANGMFELGKKLFAQIHRQKKHANHNHDVHIMAREIDEWLPQGIQSLIDGTYDPRCLKRYCFEDEVVDHVHLSDRILQHLLLKQLKPTFKCSSSTSTACRFAYHTACTDITQSAREHKANGR